MRMKSVMTLADAKTMLAAAEAEAARSSALSASLPGLTRQSIMTLRT